MDQNEQISSDKNLEDKCYDKSIQLLSEGVIQLYSPSLLGIQKQTNELMEKQLILTEQLHNENLKLAWSQHSSELQEMYNLMKLYNTKLVTIKRNMKILHERSIKLKKRTMRLQQFREKQLYIKNQHKGAE